jgi:hypothetical protein
MKTMHEDKFFFVACFCFQTLDSYEPFITQEYSKLHFSYTFLRNYRQQLANNCE